MRFGTSPRPATAAVMAVPVVIAVTAGLCLAGAMAVELQWRGGVVLVMLAFAVAGVAARAFAAIHARRPEPDDGVPLPGDAAARLSRVAEEEAAGWGVSAPEALRVTLGRDVELRDGVLRLGAFALAERPADQLRVAISAALLAESDADVVALRGRVGGMLARASAVADAHRLASLPWRWYARLARTVAAGALGAAARRAGERLEARHGDVAVAHHAGAAERDEDFERYWRGWVVPVLEAGHRPPVIAGWLRYADVEDATPLAGDLAELEAELLGGERARDLVPISWERVGAAVVLEQARERAAAADLAGATVADLADLAAWGRPDEAEVLGDALLVALAGAGWEVHAMPGDGVFAVDEGASVAPYGLVPALATGEESGAEWDAFAADVGIAELPLDPPDTAPDGLLEALVEGPAAVPPGLRFEATIAASRGHAVGTLLSVGLGLLLGMPLAALQVYEGFTFDGPSWAGPVLVGAGVALGAGLALWTRSRWRLVRAKGRVVLDADGLRIEHPTLLRRPYAVPRQAIRSAVVDERTDRRDVQGRRVRLPIARSRWAGEDERAWLWIEKAASFVPYVGVADAPPTLALVFNEPVAGPRMRRERIDGPLRGEAVGGLLLAAEPGPGASAVLARLGFAPELDATDAELLLAAFDPARVTA
jgi:hypothetical protein